MEFFQALTQSDMDIIFTHDRNACNQFGIEVVDRRKKEKLYTAWANSYKECEEILMELMFKTVAEVLHGD